MYVSLIHSTARNMHMYLTRCLHTDILEAAIDRAQLHLSRCGLFTINVDAEVN
jgi:hypothetical protein